MTIVKPTTATERELFKDDDEVLANTIDTLERAVAVLDEYGWKQGDFGSTRSGFCALGAIEFAETSMIHHATRMLIDACAPLSIVTFNDAPGRHKHEVQAKLRKAARRARALARAKRLSAKQRVSA
jgi:hypothetical protein